MTDPLKKLIVVGNGMVGQRFVDDLIANGGLDSFDLTVIGDEPIPAYDRVALSSWFNGVSTEELTLSLSLIHISEPRDQRGSRMPSSA